MILRRSCKQATALMVAREDRPLGMADRVALRLHLMACDACPRFKRQMLLMREALGQWRAYRDEASDAPPGATREYD